MRVTGLLSTVSILALAVGAVGCLQQSTSVKCSAPTTNGGAVRTAGIGTQSTLQRLGLSSEQLRSSCATSSQYVCNRRIFNPDIADGRNSNVQCSAFEPLGSPCLNVDSFNFNTRQAAAQAEAAQREPGGSFNYSEYSCYHSGLKDGESFLARSSQVDSLDDALKHAFEACVAIAGGGSP